MREPRIHMRIDRWSFIMTATAFFIEMPIERDICWLLSFLIRAPGATRRRCYGNRSRAIRGLRMIQLWELVNGAMQYG